MHIKQKHKDGCGAAVYAMAMGITYDEAREMLPGYTSLKAMKAALQGKQFTGKLYLVGDSTRKHWVYYNMLVYDPAFSKPSTVLNRRYEAILHILQSEV